VLVLQPACLKMFADFGGTLPPLTQAFLKPWLPPVLSSVAPIAMGLTIGLNAPGPFRGVASVVSVLFTLGQMVAFMLSMYLPIFAIAEAINT
jgi:type II secretory pathway component PulF